MPLISEYPLQIYCSALVFAPSRSVVRQKFHREIPPWICAVSQGTKNWSGKNLTIETGRRDKSWAGFLHRPYMVFSPDGQTLASSPSLGVVNFWDPTTGALQVGLATPGLTVDVIAYSPDGRFIAYYGTETYSATHTAVFGLWDVALQAVRGVHTVYHALGDAALAFSPDGGLLAIALDYRKVRVLDTKTMAVKSTMDRVRGVKKLAFSPSGQRLAVVESSRIRIYGVFDGRRITLREQAPEALAGVFSPSSDLFAFAARDHLVRFWHKERNEKQTPLVGHSSAVLCIVFSPDGR